MIETLWILPGSFWVAITLMLVGLYSSYRNIATGLGLPSVAVILTIAFWYVGDVLYNDFRTTHMQTFSAETLSLAWWQVAEFLAVFLILTPKLHRWLNRRLFCLSSRALHMFKFGVDNSQFQRSITRLYSVSGVVWILLLALAAVRYKGRYFDYLFPYLGVHPGPWVVAGLASGAMDSLLALANNLQILIGAVFGVVLALSKNPRIRILALVGVCLTWPLFIFAWTRNQILTCVLPGFLSWICFRLRVHPILKVLVIVGGFLMLNAWFGFMIANRTKGSITAALKEEGFDFLQSSKEEHGGLNMYEELCWINTFIAAGVFEPSWGGNYIANFANPIPRFLWPGKPTIGLDYALARGGGGGDTASGVSVTLSNGMIGQGVSNFGRYFGPAGAALLIGLWACWIARFDLLGGQMGYFPLYGLGLITTFLMGRDIGPLAFYPVLFGFLICWWLNLSRAPIPSTTAVGQRAPRRRSDQSRSDQGRPGRSRPPIVP